MSLAACGTFADLVSRNIGLEQNGHKFGPLQRRHVHLILTAERCRLFFFYINIYFFIEVYNTHGAY